MGRAILTAGLQWVLRVQGSPACLSTGSGGIEGVEGGVPAGSLHLSPGLQPGRLSQAPAPLGQHWGLMPVFCLVPTHHLVLPASRPPTLLSLVVFTSPQRVQLAAYLPGSPALLRAPLLWPGPARRPSRGLPK